MVNADNALFVGFSHYFEGLSKLSLAQLAFDEPVALKEATHHFEKAVERIEKVREYEEELLAVASQIDYSAYYVRRHQVDAVMSEELLGGLKMMVANMSEGYHPAKGCTVLNRIIAQFMTSIEQNARIDTAFQ